MEMGERKWYWWHVYISRSEVITSVGTISSGTAYLLLEVCCWTLAHSERDQGKELEQ